MGDAGSATGTSKQAGRTSRPFKRTYKACESCRITKSRCERDDGIDCLKCRREQRECIFPIKRSSKRTKADDVQGVKESRNARQKSGPTSAKSPQPNVSLPDEQLQGEQWRFTTHQSTTRLSSTLNSIDRQAIQTPRSGQRLPGPGDGTITSRRQIDGQSSPIGNETRSVETAPSTDAFRDQVVQAVVNNPSDAVGLLFRTAGGVETEDHPHSGGQTAAPEDHGQELSPGSLTPSLPIHETVPQQILELWSQHRFVRQGWFTEREAIGYVRAFFSSLSPLSPVLENFDDMYTSHRQLVVEEPLLCCTILMISSRHHHPPGPGGAMRASFIHGRLWRHIEHLLQRITLGAEKYSVAKSRTLSSIQALLLITDWHPRSIHFPPENDGWDASLAPSIDDTYTSQLCENEAVRRWREDVYEPAKRSDRLSWMLVGMATTLAHELGVFKPMDDESRELSTSDRLQERIRKLLYLYATQLSLRLGSTNIFPQEVLLDVLQASQPSTTQTHIQSDLMLAKWIEVTKLLSTAADMFFGTPAATKKLLRSSRYLTLLNHLKPLLESWYQDYRLYYTTQGPPQKILLADYYYVRMYIHSIAMQALVERASCTSDEMSLWPGREIWRSKHAQDFSSVKEVRDCSCKILAIAVELRQQGLLKHCPVRLYLRIVCASVFLLKALSLGSPEADAAASIETLEQAIEALDTNRADDIHLSSRYSILIGRHVQRFRAKFLVQKTDSRVLSRSRTQQHSPTREQTLGDDLHSINFALQPRDAFGPDPPDSLGQGFADPFEIADNDNAELWWTQPFDPQIAPFGRDYMEPGVGLAADSLDFLWNV